MEEQSGEENLKTEVPDFRAVIAQTRSLRDRLENELQILTTRTNASPQIKGLNDVLHAADTIFDGAEACLNYWPEDRFVRPRSMLEQTTRGFRGSFSAAARSVASSWQAYEAGAKRMAQLSKLPAEIRDRRAHELSDSAIKAYTDALRHLVKVCTELEEWLTSVKDELDPDLAPAFVSMSPLRFLDPLRTTQLHHDLPLNVIEQTARDGYAEIALNALRAKISLARAQEAYFQNLLNLSSQLLTAYLSRHFTKPRSKTDPWEQTIADLRAVFTSTWIALSTQVVEAEGSIKLTAAEKVELIVTAWNESNAVRSETIQKVYVAEDWSSSVNPPAGEQPVARVTARQWWESLNKNRD